MKQTAINRKTVLLFLLAAMLVAAPAGAAPTTEVTITKLASDGTTVLAQETVNYTWMMNNLPVMGDGVTHYYHQGPVFIDNPDDAVEQQLRWNPAENINVLEKDMGAVKGTNLKDLCDLVGGMNAGEELLVKSNDNWSMPFAYKNVYEYSDREGPMVITWYVDGLYSYPGHYPDTGYSDGMRLVWLADNSTNPFGINAFGNYDWYLAADEPYWYYYYGSLTEKYPTTTGLSGKIVSNITIFSDDPAPELTSITVSPADATVEIGVTRQFTATGYDQYANEIDNITFAWSSSNTSVGNIGQNGLFTASAAGSTIINASCGNITGTASVTVTLPAPVLTRIDVSPSTASVETGETQQFTATAYDQYDAVMESITFTWSSSNETVGTIKSGGLFSALSSGSTTITATSGLISGTASVTVTLPAPVLTSIDVSPSTASVETGETQQFTATAYDQYDAVMESITFTWSSSNETVGTINSGGLFSAASSGSTTITATSGLISGTASVTVTLPEPVLTRIEVNPSTASVEAGQTQQFSATGYDQYDAVMESITFTWSSSNETVGTINSGGLFSAVSQGATTVNATSGLISGTASVTVTLPEPVLTRIEVSPSTASVETGETQQFSATAYDQYDEVMESITFAWSGSNETVGTINSGGLFSAASPGSTIINATSGLISGTASVTVTLPAPELTRIEVSPSTASVETGETQQFSAIAYDQYDEVMESITFAWSSSNETVGTINSGGLFSALSSGSTTITATSGIISGTASMTVTLPAPILTRIEVSPSTASVETGETQQFTATGYDQYDAVMESITFAWSSSNETVGTINSGGLFSAVSPSSTTITATSGLISGTASVTVTVPAPVLTSIEVSPSTASVETGQTQQFTATGYDQYDEVMESITFTWSSSNEAVGTITQEGLFSANSSGLATVTAASGSVSGTASVTVPLPTPVLTRIEVAPTSTSVAIGETQQFTASAYDQYDTVMDGITFTWSSSNESVGIITSNGLFTAVASGSTTITAMNGTLSGSAAVMVPAATPSGDQTVDAELDIPGCNITEKGDGTSEAVINTTVTPVTISDNSIRINEETFSLTIQTVDTPTINGSIVNATVTGIILDTVPVTTSFDDLGAVTASLEATLTGIPSGAALETTITDNISADAQSAFQIAAASDGLNVDATAYTMNIIRTNLENDEDISDATIRMAVSSEWVAANGGYEAITIIRWAEDRTKEILETEYIDSENGMDIFTAFSPNGLSIFGLAATSPASVTPLQSTIQLRDYIIGLGLHHGTEQALTAKLDGAIGCLEDGAGASCSGSNSGKAEEQALKLASSHLKAFINQAEALEGKKIDAEEVEVITAWAGEIIGLIAAMD